MVYNDGYDAGMGLPPKDIARPKRPAGCSPAFVKKVWHDGYNAGEEDKLEKEFVVVKAAPAAPLVPAPLARNLLSFAENLARDLGVSPEIVKGARDLGFGIGRALYN